MRERQEKGRRALEQPLCLHATASTTHSLKRCLLNPPPPSLLGCSGLKSPLSFSAWSCNQGFTSEVKMDGGSLTITYPPPGSGEKNENHVFMTGRYDLAYTGVIPAALWGA